MFVCISVQTMVLVKLYNAHNEKDVRLLEVPPTITYAELSAALEAKYGAGAVAISAIGDLADRIEASMAAAAAAAQVPARGGGEVQGRRGRVHHDRRRRIVGKGTVVIRMGSFFA